MKEGSNIIPFPGKKESPSAPTEQSTSPSADLIPFPTPEKTIKEEKEEIDGTRLAALTAMVHKVRNTYPFYLSEERVREAQDAISQFTLADVIRVVNRLDVHNLSDNEAHLYAAYLRRLGAGFVDE